MSLLDALQPHHGIAKEHWILPPQPSAEPLWRVLVQLAEPTGARPQLRTQRTIDDRIVGAYGASRSDAVIRGAGEAVERFALRRGLNPPARHLGINLADGTTEEVDAELVDYPWALPRRLAQDPSPSGAASGGSHHAARRAALLEVLERDAVCVAWSRRLALPVIELHTVLNSASPSRDATALRRIARTVNLLPGRLHVAQVPVAAVGVTCTVAAWLEDSETHPLAAVGCCAAVDPVRSVLKSVQEALQIRSALLLAGRSQTSPGPITDDNDRAAHFAAERGYQQVQSWISGFGRARAINLYPPPVTDSSLVGDLLNDGCRPVEINLTPRLPQSAQDLGWHVVKIIPNGYQSLRMDETNDSSWDHERHRGATSRTGLAGTSDRLDWAPHPLI